VAQIDAKITSAPVTSEVVGSTPVGSSCDREGDSDHVRFLRGLQLPPTLHYIAKYFILRFVQRSATISGKTKIEV
jgi:hypothetical protein